MFFRGGTSDYVTEHEDANSLYVPISPTDVMLSEQESQILYSQFRSEQRGRVARDLDNENETFCRYMELGNLGFWFKNLFAQIVAASPVDTGKADD